MYMHSYNFVSSLQAMLLHCLNTTPLIVYVDKLSTARLMLTTTLIFNLEKCKYMVITRKRSNSLTPPPLSLGPSIIERTYSYKYLGVTISSNLSWSEHIHVICTKAKRLLGFFTDTFTLMLTLLVF